MKDMMVNKFLNFSFLFPHKRNDQWSTPLSIINEIKKRGHIVKIYSVFNQNENGYNDDGIIQMLNDAHNVSYKPDVIMHMDFGLYNSQYLTKKYFKEAVWVFESGDDPQSFQNYNFTKARYGDFDIVLSPDIRCVEAYMANGINAFWWTHFADTALYQNNDPLITYDAVSTRDQSEPFFTEIKKHLQDKFHTRRDLHAIDHSNFLRSGKIVIQNSRYKEITRRIFEGMLAKRLVITDRIDQSTKLNELFIENEDIIYYDTVEEAIDKIKYYCKNDVERNKIALNGWQKVLKNHTQVQRVDTLIKLINEIKNKL